MISQINEHTVPWPADVAKRYVAEGYWAGVAIGTEFRAVAERSPDTPALIDPVVDCRLSRQELADRADAAAVRLLGLGLKTGDRIVVQLPNGWEFVVLTMACLRVGIVPVMALPAHRRTELSYLVEHAEAVAIAVPDRLRDFDHEALGHELASIAEPITHGMWHVLVAGENVEPNSVDLRSLCAPSEDAVADLVRIDELEPG
ncbi:MAG: AMP-binding protein, partial [Acidimicrobiales bacterium]|nr:AMP-binding protein [Acidimicrobiales bacterium]